MRTGNSLLFSPLFAIAGVTAVSQPTLGPGALNPLPGESYTVYFCSYTTPGFGGPNQTWDFSGIACTIEPPGVYQDPAGNPLFPTATAMFDFFYLEGSSSALLELGFSAPGPDVMTCTDPLQLFAYPMTYGDQFMDNMDCDRSNTQITHRSGNTTVVADGYGTVILPYGAFTDCLRIHEDRTYMDVDQQTLSTTNFHRDFYHFVQPGIKRPLVSVLQTTWSINGGPMGSGSSASMLVDLSTGINSAGAQLLPVVRPNPMEEEATIDVPGASATAGLRMIISDALGREMRSETMTALPYLLQRGSLVSGMYTCRVLAGTRSIAVASVAVR